MSELKSLAFWIAMVLLLFFLTTRGCGGRMDKWREFRKEQQEQRKENWEERRSDWEKFWDERHERRRGREWRRWRDRRGS